MASSSGAKADAKRIEHDRRAANRRDGDTKSATNSTGVGLGSPSWAQAASGFGGAPPVPRIIPAAAPTTTVPSPPVPRTTTTDAAAAAPGVISTSVGEDADLLADFKKTVTAAQLSAFLQSASQISVLQQQLEIAMSLHSRRAEREQTCNYPPSQSGLPLHYRDFQVPNYPRPPGGSRAAVRALSDGDSVSDDRLDDAPALQHHLRRRAHPMPVHGNAHAKINISPVDSFLVRREAAVHFQSNRGPLPSLQNRLTDDLRMFNEKDSGTAAENFFYHLGRIFAKIPGVSEYLTAFSLLNPDLLSDSHYLIDALLYRLSSQGTSGFRQIMDQQPRAGGEIEDFLRICASFDFVRMYRLLAPSVQLMCLRRIQTTIRPDLDYFALQSCGHGLLSRGDLSQLTSSQRVWDFTTAEVAFQREFSNFVHDDKEKVQRPIKIDAGALHMMQGDDSDAASSTDHSRDGRSRERGRAAGRGGRGGGGSSGRNDRDRRPSSPRAPRSPPPGIPAGFIFPDQVGICFHYYRTGSCRFRDVTHSKPRRCKLHHYKPDNAKLVAAISAFTAASPSVVRAGAAVTPDQDSD